MGKLPQSDRPLIEPIYPQTSPNQLIELGNTMVEFTHEEKTYRKTARTTVEFLPRIRGRAGRQRPAQINDRHPPHAGTKLGLQTHSWN